MEAFHSFWSLPNTVRSGGTIAFPDFELLTAILSALSWQKHNGPIRMITDSPGAAFFKENGLGDLWVQIDTTLDHMDPDIDPVLFWAAGKLYALKSMPAPCVMLDTDLIIWKNLDSIFPLKDIIAAHSEALNPAVYPDRSVFRFKDDYQFPSDWNFSLEAANTAFLYMKDRAFRDHYADTAIEFFKRLSVEGLNPVTAMCFAEQRVLPMLADACGKEIGYLFHLLSIHSQDLATHTWGFKTVLRTDPRIREDFCMRCVTRILTEFPDRSHLLTNSELLLPYYRRYRQLHE